MLLRTQIALLLSGAILLVAVGVAGVGIWQRNLDAQRLTNIALALQSSLWNNLVDETVGDLNLVASELSVRLSNLAPSLSPDAIGDVIDASPDIVTPQVTVQVVSNEGDLIRANATVLHSLPLIDRQILNRFSLGASMIGGLRQESRERFVIAAMRAIAIQGTQRALLSVSVPADEIVSQMADDIGEPLFLLSPRGRLVVGTDPALWARAQLSIPRHAARSRLIDVDGQSYFAVAMRVHDLSGREGGTMVALRDVTEAQLFSGGVERVGLVVVALAALLMVAALYALLRQAFQPLEDAVGVLDALSKGELPRPIDHTGAGEIGRIAKAVAVFRRNTQQLVDQNEAIARQRRRQERVIRRELERLAGLLDAEGRAEILGDLATVLPDNPDRQSASHMELATLAQLLSLMSKRIADQQNRLTGLVAELRDSIATRARLAALEQELDIARELQRTFLPQPLAPDPRFEVFGLMESAKEVGGDFFDTFMINENALGIVVADVSGKGVPAALFMAITRTLIKATALSGAAPSTTVREVNAFLAADNEQMMFVTLFLGVYHINEQTLTFVNAGHNPPYVVTGDGVTPLQRVGGPALAVVEDAAFRECTLTLAPGATLFAYTDGVTEAFNPGGIAYGEERLEQALTGGSALSAEALSQRVRQDVLDFEDGADQADDVTCFTLKVNA